MLRLSRTWGVLACTLVTLIFVGSRSDGQILLSDIVAGGDGSGNAPDGVTGIDPRNGEFTDTLIAGHIFETDAAGDGVNPSAVAASDLVDSVFFIGEATFDDGGGRVAPIFGGDPVAVALTQSGVEFEFLSEDGFGSSWNHILSNLSAGGGTPFMVGGQVVAHGVGIHAAAGITFDLDAIRNAHGAESVGCFQTVWGMDGCGSGDVNLYAIVSDETSIIESHNMNALVNSGELLQVDLPDDARYLTLATGSNGPDGCDHGNFGVARIVGGDCVETIPIESLAISPAETSLPPGGLLQLTVTATDEIGQVFDVTTALSGTVYSVEPAAGVLDVSADGYVTATGDGEASITATNDGLAATAQILVTVPDYIDLGDVAVGGDGLGLADPLNIGINADTGEYTQSRLSADIPDANFINPMPVDGFDGSADNPLVNSVFVMTTDFGQPITTELIPFDFELGDQAGGVGWEAILNGREPGGDDFLEFGVRGDGTGIVFEEGLGMHASQGITFDLEAIRAEHGSESVAYISAVAGELTSERNNAGLVNTYIILTDEEDVLDIRTFLGASNVGRFQQMEIPEEAVYATFAVGAAGNGIGSDHGGFGLARITAEPVETEIASVEVTPASLVLNIGESRKISVAGVLGGELNGIGVDVDPADVEFSSDDAAIAEVDDEGNVLGEATGNTVVHVMALGTTVDIPVQVGTILDLGDIVGGGDGTGTADGILLGIDPRNGTFADFPVDGHLYEADFEGDTLDPSPVDDSDFVDSVFIIGERGVGEAADVPVGGPPIEQPINLEEVMFDFPSEDGFGSSWNHILADENGGAVDGQCLVGGQVYETGIGVHAACGITFDLEAIREAHGADAAGVLSTVAGMDACGGDVNLYVIFSDSEEVLASLSVNATGNSGEELNLPVPVTASYLTLACGSNGADGCDHGTFGDAKLLAGPGLQCPDEGDTHCTGLAITSVGERSIFGTYSTVLEASATDDSGDPITFSYTIIDPNGATTAGSEETGEFTLSLREGVHTMTVVVDDDSTCGDAADDNTCTLEFTVPPEVDSGPTFRRGDADDNGQVQLTDAVRILGFLFQGLDAPVCFDAADADDNREVQLTDAVRVLGFLFQGTEEPPFPGPLDCGEDPEDPDDALGCESYESCDA